MFYDADLLCLKRGKFAMIWILATRGKKFVSADRIQKIDIVRSGNDILKYVTSNSAQIKCRLSLYLSAQLIYGLTIAFREQTHQLENDLLINFYRIVRSTTIIYDDIVENGDDDGSAKKRKGGPSKKRIKKPRIIVEEIQVEEQQQSVTEQPLQTNENLISDFHITIRDDYSRTRQPEIQDNMFGDELQQIAPDLITELSNFMPTTMQESINPPTLEELDRPELNLIVPPPEKRIRLEDGGHVSPVVNVIQRGSVSPDLPRNGEQEVIQMEQEPIPEQQRQEESIPEQVVREPTHRRRQVPPRNRKPYNNETLPPNKWKQIKFVMNPIQKTTILNFDDIDVDALIKDILEDVEAQDLVRDIKEKCNLSTDSGPGELTKAPATDMATHLYAVSEHTETVTQPGIIQIAPVPINEESLIIERVSILEPLSSSTPKARKELDTSTPKSKGSSKSKKNFLHLIRKKFRENDNKPLKLEELCETLTKKIVAITFHLLLNLHGKEYVKLINVPESVQLDCIEPGRYLYDD